MKSTKDESLVRLTISSNDEEDVESQILWIDDSSYTRQPLIESLGQQEHVQTFLKALGITWPDENCHITEICARYSWNVLIRSILVVCPILIVLNFSIYLVEAKSYAGFDIASWSLDFIFIMQSAALLNSLVAICRRLSSISTALEISFFPESLKYCVIYMALSFFPSILYPCYHLLLVMPSNSGVVRLAVYSLLPLCELVVLGLLSVHMLFILVDCQTLAANFALLSENIKGTPGHQGSGMKYEAVLAEIRHRARTSLLETLPIILTALMEIFVLCYMVREDMRSKDYMPMLLLIFLFLKEIQFLLLVLAVLTYCLVKRATLEYKKRT
jgi:hypothetical protein